jgi:DNA-binding response OmpR family regulator
VASTVLVVEDERKLRELLRAYFERENLVVYSTSSGAEAIEVGRRSSVDLVVLDLGLPDLSGEEVARELRECSNVPIIMLTAKSEERDRIAGLELGADDYVSKPFSPRELVLRVQAVLRRGRSSVEEAPVASYGNGELVIDNDRRRVDSRYELINQVRGYEFEGYERTVNSHIKNLRHKVELEDGKPRLLETVLGGGYRLGLMRDA